MTSIREDYDRYFHDVMSRGHNPLPWEVFEAMETAMRAEYAKAGKEYRFMVEGDIQEETRQ